MNLAILKREYGREFAKDYGTQTANEVRLAKDLERAYTMIETLRNGYAEDGEKVGANQEEQIEFDVLREVAAELTRILEGVEQ